MDDIQAQPLIARLDQAQLVGVNITGGDAPPVLHGDSGGEGFASRGCTGVQHPPPRLRRGGQHRQMGGGILDVKVPLLERLQVFQTSGAVQPLYKIVPYGAEALTFTVAHQFIILIGKRMHTLIGKPHYRKTVKSQKAVVKLLKP